jgi:hypothetical protein
MCRAWGRWEIHKKCWSGNLMGRGHLAQAHFLFFIVLLFCSLSNGSDLSRVWISPFLCSLPGHLLPFGEFSLGICTILYGVIRVAWLFHSVPHTVGYIHTQSYFLDSALMPHVSALILVSPIVSLNVHISAFSSICFVVVLSAVVSAVYFRIGLITPLYILTFGSLRNHIVSLLFKHSGILVGTFRIVR